MSTETSFAQLSDDALVAELNATVASRRQIAARLVALLVEVEARQLHLKAAYRSMLEYCVSHLGLSQSSANRAAAAASAARRHPEIVGLIAEGRLHLSGIQLLAPYLRQDCYPEMLGEAVDKTKAEIAQLVCSHFPRADVPSSIAVSTEQQPHACSTSLQLAPLSPQSFHVQFTAGTELRDKLERARDLMAHVNPSRDLATVVDRALDLLIAQLEKRKFAKTARPHAPRRVQAGRVSNSTRRDVSSRDDYQCAFVSEDGRRCTARSGLEYDHVEPKARGGGEDSPNLRLLCRAHNQLHAFQSYGEAFVRNKIQLRQRTSTTNRAQPPSLAVSPEPPKHAEPPSLLAAVPTTHAEQSFVRSALVSDPAASFQHVRNKLVHALTHQGFSKPAARNAVNSLHIDVDASIASLLRQAFASLAP